MPTSRSLPPAVEGWPTVPRCLQRWPACRRLPAAPQVAELPSGAPRAEEDDFVLFIFIGISCEPPWPQSGQRGQVSIRQTQGGSPAFGDRTRMLVRTCVRDEPGLGVRPLPTRLPAWAGSAGRDGGARNGPAEPDARTLARRRVRARVRPSSCPPPCGGSPGSLSMDARCDSARSSLPLLHLHACEARNTSGPRRRCFACSDRQRSGRAWAAWRVNGE